MAPGQKKRSGEIPVAGKSIGEYLTKQPPATSQMAGTRGRGGLTSDVGQMDTVRLDLDSRLQEARATTHMSLQKSFILIEGWAAEASLTAWEKATRWTYTTWNSIPIRYAPVIGWELGVAMLKRMWSALPWTDDNPLNLKPNYPQLHFTPLEMSFTRRPNGALNWIKDIFTGKPYRLISDMRDGYLYSPEGGSLKYIFLTATKLMINNPITLMKLKKERAEKLAEAVNYYRGKYINVEEMSHTQLLQALVEVGKRNTDIFYRFGFGDTQLEIGEAEIRRLVEDNAKTPQEAELLIKTIEAAYTKRTYLNVPNRGYQGAGKWAPTTGFVVMRYALPELKDRLVVDMQARTIYENLPDDVKKQLSRAFKLREEGVQEGEEATKAIEYCRSTFYRLAEQLGKTTGVDVRFLTIYELSDWAKMDKPYDRKAMQHLQETIRRRGTKLKEFEGRAQ